MKRGWKNSSRQPVANRDLWEPFIELVLARRRRHLPVGEGPQRRPDERPGRPPGGRGGRHPGGPQPARGSPPTSVRPTRSARPRPRRRRAATAGSRPVASCWWPGTVPASWAGTTPTRWPRRRHPAARDAGGHGRGGRSAHGRQRPAPRAPSSSARRRRSPSTCPRGRAAVPRGGQALAGGVPHAASPSWSPRPTSPSRSRSKAPPPSSSPARRWPRRDAWLAKQVDSAVVVWDQEDDAVGRLVRSLEDHLGPDQVLLVHP